jgi:hypothetical protein
MKKEPIGNRERCRISKTRGRAISRKTYKDRSIKSALRLYGALKAEVEQSEDPLQTEGQNIFFLKVKCKVVARNLHEI